MYLFAAIIYFVISFAASFLVKRLEARTAIMNEYQMPATIQSRVPNTSRPLEGAAMIELSHVSKWYGQSFRVLTESCLDNVNMGEVVGFAVHPVWEINASLNARIPPGAHPQEGRICSRRG